MRWFWDSGPGFPSWHHLTDRGCTASSQWTPGIDLIVCCHSGALGICHSWFKPAKTEHNTNCSHEMNYKNNMCIQYTPLFLQASIPDYGCLKEKRSVNNAAVLRKFKLSKYSKTNKAVPKKFFLSKIAHLFWYHWTPRPWKCSFRRYHQRSVTFKSRDMDKYAFSGSHFEKSKMAAMRMPVQMETLVFWLLIPTSFQKCIVFQIPKKIPRKYTT